MYSDDQKVRRGHADINFYQGENSGPCLPIYDLIRSILEASNGEQRKFLLGFCAAQPEFGECAAELLAGHSDHEYSTHNGGQDTYSANALRMALVPHADAAARKIIQVALEENQRLRDQLSEKNKHIKKLLDDWPESYKKYIPKEACVYSSLYIGEGQVERLIEYVKTKEG